MEINTQINNNFNNNKYDNQKLTSFQLKKKADEYANLMKSSFDQSQNFWKNGDKAKAKEYSNKGNEYKAILMEINKEYNEVSLAEKSQKKNISIKEDAIKSIVQEKDYKDKINEYLKILNSNSSNSIEFLINEDDKNIENENEKIEKAYFYHRQKADEYGELMANAFKESQNSWNSGDKGKAKELSEIGYIFKQTMETHKANAIKLIATKNNNKRDSDEIDLHGLNVNEAIEFFKETLRLKFSEGNFESIKVIVGKGLHSKDKPKLKQAIANYAANLGLQVFEQPGNEGVIIIFR
jgi:DNA-nicking Smr family endonuclease